MTSVSRALHLKFHRHTNALFFYFFKLFIVCQLRLLSHLLLNSSVLIGFRFCPLTSWPNSSVCLCVISEYHGNKLIKNCHYDTVEPRFYKHRFYEPPVTWTIFSDGTRSHMMKEMSVMNRSTSLHIPMPSVCWKLLCSYLRQEENDAVLYTAIMHCTD